MKSINRILIASLSIAACLFLGACSDDDEKAPVEFSFTALNGADTSLLDEQNEVIGSFELDITGDWSLYSDKIWATLSLDSAGEFFNDLRGREGKYTVYVKVTNEARTFNGSQAVITLLAGDREEVVATVVRPAKSYAFGAIDAEGAGIESLNIGYDAESWVGFDANFDCAIISYPQWMNEPLATDGGYTVSVADDYQPMPQSGELLFGNVDGTIRYSLPVAYSGMDPKKMVIESDYSPWGWYVTLDGKSFSLESNDPSGETVVTTVEESLCFTVKCLNYDCRFVMLEERDGVLYTSSSDDETAWVNVLRGEEEKSRVSVSVEPFDATTTSRSRSGYLFAVPAALYENFMTALAANPNSLEFVDAHISFVLLQITQKDLEGTMGFEITDASGSAVECVAEEEFYEWLCSEYSITDVATATLVPGERYTLNTKLTPADWAKNFGLSYLDGGTVRISRWSVETALGEDGLYRISLTVPATLDEPVILRLYTPQIINIKALVIRPATN